MQQMKMGPPMAELPKQSTVLKYDATKDLFVVIAEGRFNLVKSADLVNWLKEHVDN